MQQTSWLAFRSLENIGQKQKACYGVLKDYGPSANYDIAESLGWGINRVTPRVKELRELGLVKEAYRDLHPSTNRKVIYWEVKGELICQGQKLAAYKQPKLTKSFMEKIGTVRSALSVAKKAAPAVSSPTAN